MGPSDKYEPPKPTAKDHAHTLVRAGLGSIPYVGAAATELFQLVVAPSLDKRRGEWMEEVAEGLKQLEEKQLEEKAYFRLGDLAQNDEFIDTLLHASNVAMRTSQKEKREALHNAVLNSALPNPPDESRQQMFVQMIDSFTVWHLRILTLFANPRRWFEKNGKKTPEYYQSSHLEGLLLDAYPELKSERDLYDQVVRDLYSKGLLDTGAMRTMMSADGALENHATDSGHKFLDFVTAPTVPE